MAKLFLPISLSLSNILQLQAFYIIPQKPPFLSTTTTSLHDKKDEGPSYSDNFLLDFHNTDQAVKQLISNSLTVWNKEQQREQVRIIEWQDSFQRNGLADFTPPMSSGLNCLMVGGEELGGKNIKLPWEEEAEADVTPLRILEPEMDDGDESSALMNNDIASDDDMPEMSVPLVRTERVHTAASSPSSDSKIRVVDPTKTAGQYDCIVDQGLMDAVIALDSPESIQELLFEAAFAIREHGIYVLVTSKLSDKTRQTLEECTDGFEWEFELDGISNDSQVVSVARRYCTGEMPKVGKLSRYQP